MAEMNWTIRDATIADYDGLCALFAQVDRVHYTALPDIFRPGEGPVRERSFVEELLADPDTRLFVATQGDAIVGMAQASVLQPRNHALLTPLTRVYLDDIIVDEQHRSAGLGKALLDHVERWVRQLGVGRIELTVWEFNVSARALYERQGYTTLNRTMSKKLDE